ncbi:MAG: hypothetical protein K2J15_04400 [Muribaculaceae bacterium]|nr:hypothetical protein [Muribaculaceae bacterium]
MVKEKTIEILYRLGFSPEELDDDMGYRFDYEGMNLLYSAEDDDANSITFMMPGIFEISGENRVAVLEAMFKLCAKMKFVQPTIILDSVWLQYQHYMPDVAEPNEVLIAHIIHVLAVATAKFHQIINNEDNESDDQ